MSIGNKLTDRQFAVWQAWLRNRWNQPDRSDYYVMQLTAEVRNLFSKQFHQADECRIKWKWCRKAASVLVKLLPKRTGPPKLDEPPPPMDEELMAMAQEKFAIARQQEMYRRLGGR